MSKNVKKASQPQTVKLVADKKDTVNLVSSGVDTVKFQQGKPPAKEQIQTQKKKS